MDILIDGAKELGLELSAQQTEKFLKYWELLAEANRHMNLTAVTGREEVFKRHFLDSLALIKAANFSGARVMDVGSGAGFPGLPIKIACEDADMTLLDGQMKRIKFLQKVCVKIGVSAECIHGRAEELGKKEGFRESYDYALSRAVARLDVLTELCLPLVKLGGRLLAMKADASEEETEAATTAINTLGGRLMPTVSYIAPDSGALRKIVVIEKVAPTPLRYPRRFAKIQKSPIA